MRLVRVWITLLGVGLGIVGCAGPQLSPVTIPTQRLEFEGFSILPPHGENWLVTPPAIRAKQGSNVIVSFYKRLNRPSKTHTVIAVVASVWLPAEMGTRAERLQKYAQAALTGRYRPVMVNISPDGTLAPDCIRIDATTEDRGVPGYPGTPFIADTHAFVCFHPDWPEAAIDIHYSQRRLLEEAPLSLEAEGEPFVRSLIFTRLPGRSSP